MGEKLTIQERVILVFMFAKDGVTYRSVAEPLDYFLWEHLKSVIYQNRPRNLDDLKDAITTECQRISTETINRVKDSFTKSIDACSNAEGEQFEQLL